MRLNDLNGGSIKALLILVLLAANIALAFPLGSARVSRAGFRRPAETNFPSNPRSPAKFAMAKTPSPARETHALPDQPAP
jgi:hypothetical protein